MQLPTYLANRKMAARGKVLVYLMVSVAFSFARLAYSQAEDELELFYDTEVQLQSETTISAPTIKPVNKESATTHSKLKSYVSYNGFITHLEKYIYFVNGKPLSHWLTTQLLSVSSDRRRLTILLPDKQKLSLHIGVAVEGHIN